MNNKLFIKKITSCFMAFVFVISLGVCSVFAGDSDSNLSDEYNEKISRGKILSGGHIQVYEIIECTPETAHVTPTGEKIYQKTVYVTKQFKNHVKENIFQVKSEICQKFIFEYDKIGKVSVVESDITSENEDSKWALSSISEVLKSKLMCTISNQYRVHKKLITGNYEYVIDGYVDIFCTSDGVVGINSDVY